MYKTIRTVACAVSGGVDSAVSAYLLKKNGFEVKGVFMKNWDQLDEGAQCSTDVDRQDAQYVCEKLDIPFYELNFFREYWNYVFIPLLKSYQCGATPNPDVLCNRFVKFNLLTKSVLRHSSGNSDESASSHYHCINADAVATGHYCQNSFGNFLEKRSNNEGRLLRSVDPVKDQTFWLSTISHKELELCMFPVGGLLKTTVKEIARQIGLTSTASRRESMGMCFIGKRRFTDFIDSYIEPKPGLFKELGSGVVLDEHRGIHHFTLGQRANITRVNGPFYVSQMNYPSQDVYVVKNPNHPSLFMRKCWTGPAVWINSSPPTLPSRRIQFQWQNKWRAVGCTIKPHNSLEEAANDAQSVVCRGGYRSCGSEILSTIDSEIESQRTLGSYLSIELDEPMRCVAAGQWVALYDGDCCLGGAMICGSVSLWDEGHDSPYMNWVYSNYELHYPESTCKKAKQSNSRDDFSVG
ncbi:unnamed protein product [Calicophoron daubneyi]|uniref:tRNA-5-taurinomethyluridine 2-sulfurtransferase n=1 Tax=Calicophoron daubneyi TaxID=300641 RepID=A0AAV2T8H4_CALDB